MTDEEFNIALDVLKSGEDTEEIMKMVVAEVANIDLEMEEVYLDRQIKYTRHMRSFIPESSKIQNLKDEIKFQKERLKLEKKKFNKIPKSNEVDRLKCLRTGIEIQEIIKKLESGLKTSNSG